MGTLCSWDDEIFLVARVHENLDKPAHLDYTNIVVQICSYNAGTVRHNKLSRRSALVAHARAARNITLIFERKKTLYCLLRTKTDAF